MTQEDEDLMLDNFVTFFIAGEFELFLLWCIKMLQNKQKVLNLIFDWFFMAYLFDYSRDKEHYDLNVCCWSALAPLEVNVLLYFGVCHILGQETTANQLAFCIMELARHPDILEKWEPIVQCEAVSQCNVWAMVS